MRLSRREILQVASASAAGSILLGNGDTVAAGSDTQNTKEYGRRTFLDISIGMTETPKASFSFGDMPKEYDADWESRRLILDGRFVGKDADKAFENGDTVLRGNAYTTNLNGLYGIKSRNFPVHRGKGINLAKEIVLPKINVTSKGNQSGVYRISADGESVEVRPRHFDTLVLPSREVQVPRRAESTKTVPSKKTGELIEVFQLGDPELVQIQPQITIINHGRVQASKTGGSK